MQQKKKIKLKKLKHNPEKCEGATGHAKTVLPFNLPAPRGNKSFLRVWCETAIRL